MRPDSLRLAPSIGLLLLIAHGAFAATQPSFNARRDYLVNGIALGGAIADVNGDGIPDLVINVADVQVFFGDGSGAYTLGPFSPLSGEANYLLATDLNGDGIADLVYVAGTDLCASLGNGDGTFQLGACYPSDVPNPEQGEQIVYGDFTGDGVPDAILDEAAGLWLFVGHSDGTFSPGVLTVPLPLGSSPMSAYDLDGDGNLDIVVGLTLDGNGGSGWDVIYGNGDGTFQPPINYASPQRTSHLQAGVLLPGGPPEVVMDVDFTGYLAVFQYNGNRSFLPPVYDYVPTEVLDLADVNNDGFTDVIDPTGLIAFGAGNRKFPKTATYAVEYAGYTERQVLHGDLRHSGRQDIVTVSEDAVSVLLNKGGGRFQDGNYTPVSGGVSCATTGDFNGDGKPDMALATASGVVILLGTSSTVHPFTTGVTLPVSNAECPQTADLNGDGIVDVVVHNFAGVTAFLGMGDGTFTQTSFTATSVDCHIILGDFNHDGKADFATCGNLLAYGHGDGTFGTPKAFVPNPVPAGYSYIAVGDINGDGWPDLVLTNVQLPYANVAVLLNNQHGGFTQSDAGFGQLSNSAILTDLNGDGKLDLVVGYITGTQAFLYLGDGTGKFAAGPVLTGYNGYEFPSGYYSVADYNGDGIPDVAVMGANTISVFPGLGNATYGEALSWGAGLAPTFLLSANLQGQPRHSGKADLAATDANGGVLVLFNTTK